MDETNKMASGSLFLDTLEFLKSQKGEEAVTALEKMSGTLLFDRYRMYPLEDLLTLQRAVVKLVFGAEEEAGYRALGQHEFQSFAASVVGATLSNVGASPVKLLEKMQEVWNVVVNFGERKLTLADETAKRAIVSIKDDPRPPSYIQGVIEAGLASIGINPKTTILNTTKDEEYQVEIIW